MTPAEGGEPTRAVIPADFLSSTPVRGTPEAARLLGNQFSSKSCQLNRSNGYFHYDRFYEQQNSSISIEVTGGGTRNRNMSKPL